jgi:hypothetical protein
MNATIKNIVDAIKSLLVPIGVFLIGKNIAGHVIDENLWQMILGGVMAVLGLITSFIGHTATVEVIQAGLSAVIKSALALMLAFGVIQSDNSEIWVPLVALVSQQVYRWQSKKKTQQLDAGKITINDLKK